MAATNLLNRVATEDVVDKEIFGDGLKNEIRKAKQILSDFADYYASVRKNRIMLEEMLDACTSKGQVAKVMQKIRQEYI